MSIRNLCSLFEPGSVAVIGASSRPERIGYTVLNNMAECGFAGALWPVNPKYAELRGVPCYHRVSALPRAPELALICTPPETVPGLIAELGARGTRAAVVLTPGLAEARGGGKNLRQAMLDAARPHRLRILGPGGIGLLAPHAGLNASMAQVGARPGKIAFVSQSGMLMAAVLDWARQQGIGFSRVVSLGEGADIDLGDLLDFLAGDSDTTAIVMHMESVSNARKFMSAARMAARGKPVIVMKAGREGDDKVIDAAIRRAGMLRVYSSADLFDAVETVARARPLRGERLAILSNGGSLGLLADDALRWRGMRQATLSAPTQRRLEQMKPAPVVAQGTLVVGGEATPERYAAVLDALIQEPQVDALLLIHAPSTAAASADVARVLAPMAKAAGKSVLSCWLGGAGATAARETFAEAGLPCYDTPEKATRAFMQIAQYQRNQALLIEVPAQAPPAPERSAARAIVDAALAQGITALSREDSQAVLAAYGIPLAAPPRRRGEGSAAAAADAAGGGAAQAGGELRSNVRSDIQLRVAVRIDPVFGPAISFGQGGPAALAVDDRAVGLPPLNMVLARDVVARTRVARLLADHSEAICRVLIQVAELAVDIGELAVLEIDPLLAGAGGVRVQDARIELGPRRAEASLAIRPYPQELEQDVAWQGETLLLRPIRPEDAPAHLRFFSALHADDVRMRFFTAMRELPPAQLARLTQIDYDRAMAFIATRSGADGQPETLGVVRAVADPDNQRAEFAIVVRSDLKGKGLGVVLFEKLVAYFRARGTRELWGETLSENAGMQRLIKRFGGTVTPSAETGIVELLLRLQQK
ncbi:bifunctional acetate--CoA ligase family protein/GNAT family N-acetyltransferase [Pseudoduganella violacea]|uniref:Acyl-CoA synthetase (NDP forming)/RimJ/RimL family protein N-acetyltransferase n=1 Tax=Pseudoduganella violacea TaxID=1715466 RepID=A0A7W5BEC9_9BURK|nr:GNAT family N-acetyltransferase [Pseudoduganella violacea]MBB3121647.1 acyl-CoA synthetase (NDP forming)/RimJ/RimL family protein N-acetyltransferase [Pseudoduganella violacea]